MRDKKRIKRILKLIEKLWLKYPDQRLGQLLSNSCFGHHEDIFFQEDDESYACLKYVLKKETRVSKTKHLDCISPTDGKGKVSFEQ